MLLIVVGIPGVHGRERRSPFMRPTRSFATTMVHLPFRSPCLTHSYLGEVKYSDQTFYQYVRREHIGFIAGTMFESDVKREAKEKQDALDSILKKKTVRSALL
jgi:hypothetical protein